MKEEYVAIIEEGVLTVFGPFTQSGGWYVQHTPQKQWELFEVPLYGGTSHGGYFFDTFPEAVEYAETYFT